MSDPVAYMVDCGPDQPCLWHARRQRDAARTAADFGVPLVPLYSEEQLADRDARIVALERESAALREAATRAVLTPEPPELAGMLLARKILASVGYECSVADHALEAEVARIRLRRESEALREPDAPDGGVESVRYHFLDETAVEILTAEGPVKLGSGWLAITEQEYATLRRATPRNGGTASFGRVVVAISGGLGAGKGSLAAALAERMDAARVSFGVEVRRAVAEMGADPSDMERLQTVGQALVVTDCNGLIDRTLAQATGPADRPLVISGLRHVEVWCELRRRFPMIRLVHVDTPDDMRAARLMERESVERRLVARFDNALSEVQSSRILPQYATARVNGRLPVDLQANYAATFLNLDLRARIATPRDGGRMPEDLRKAFRQSRLRRALHGPEDAWKHDAAEKARLDAGRQAQEPRHD